ncbi:MAG: hypothetical protein ACOC0T_07100, partial [Desulfovermiculus sp.]
SWPINSSSRKGLIRSSTLTSVSTPMSFPCPYCFPSGITATDCDPKALPPGPPGATLAILGPPGACLAL